MAVRIVQLGTPRAKGEGLRIGTVRRPPRGVPKERFAADDWYDVWYPNLSPSIATLKIGQEATPSLSNIFLDFTRLHGSPRKAMAQFNREIPTLLVSFGQPYYLYDAPNHATYVNAYCSLAATQRMLVQRLTGEAPFTGVSPVDPFCGMEQLEW